MNDASAVAELPGIALVNFAVTLCAAPFQVVSGGVKLKFATEDALRRWVVTIPTYAQYELGISGARLKEPAELLQINPDTTIGALMP